MTTAARPGLSPQARADHVQVGRPLRPACRNHAATRVLVHHASAASSDVRRHGLGTADYAASSFLSLLFTGAACQIRGRLRAPDWASDGSSRQCTGAQSLACGARVGRRTRRGAGEQPGAERDGRGPPPTRSGSRRGPGPGRSASSPRTPRHAFAQNADPGVHLVTRPGAFSKILRTGREAGPLPADPLRHRTPAGASLTGPRPGVACRRSVRL